MKLENITSLCINYEPKIKITINNGPTHETRRINGHVMANAIVKYFIENKLFLPLCNEIIGINNVYKSTTEGMLVNYEEASAYLNATAKLKAAMVGFSSVMDMHAPINGPGILSFKFPRFESFDEFTEIVRDMNRSVAILLLDDSIGENVKIKKFDNGSLWIDIIIGVGLGSKVLAAVIWASCVIRKRMIENQMLEKNARTLDLKNEMLQALVEAQKKQLDNLLLIESVNVADGIIGKNDPELLRKISTSITTISQLVYKGAEFQISTESPKELIDSFPDFTKIEQLESRIPRIEDKRE